MIKTFMHISLLSIFNFLTACGQQTYDQKLNSLYKNTVNLMQPERFDSLRNKQAITILDTRSKKEFNVSHIKNAQFIDYDEFEVTQVNIEDKDQTIVVYCSVGYRSERVGEALKKAGYKNVFNLYGGIFQWKNEGYEVVNLQNEKTDSVHTYNKRWGQWLNDTTAIKVTD